MLGVKMNIEHKLPHMRKKCKISIENCSTNKAYRIHILFASSFTIDADAMKKKKKVNGRYIECTKKSVKY